MDGLGFKPKKWYRFYFEDESEKSIQKAFRNRVEIKSMLDDGDYRKALYRSQWDFLSMQFTRIATCITHKKLRQGRLKSAMVKITGDGLKALSEYKKIPYYQWRFKDENGNIYTDPKEEQFPQKTDLIKGKYHGSAVVVDSAEKKSTPPPKLIDLASLSAQLATKGIKAKQVLDTYQKMYEDNIVSYPRTEDKFITPEQFNDLLPHANQIAKLVGVDVTFLTHTYPRPTHVKTGYAHGENRPGLNVPSSLAALNKYGSCAAAIYEILAKSYLAMLCDDYIYTHQTGHLKEYPTFKGSVNIPVSLGFKNIFGMEEEDNGKCLGKQAEPFEFEGFPPKPPTPTVKWLMKQLEKYDVGTGATRTSTFAEVSNEKLSDSLIKESKGKITLSEFGEMSYQILPNTHIGSLELTEQVYREMKAIAEGTGDSDTYLKQIRQYILDDIKTMQENYQKMKADYADSKDMVNGIYIPTGESISFNRVWGGHTFTDGEVEKLFAGEEISFDAVSKSGSKYTATGKLAQQEYKKHKFWGFLYQPVQGTGSGENVPSDKVEGTYKPKKKKIRFKGEFSGHTFTKDEITKLLNGDTISFEATSKAGKAYTATGKLAEQTYNGTKYWGFKLNMNR